MIKCNTIINHYDNAFATTAASSLLALVNGLDNKSNKFNQLDKMQNHMSILITAQNEKKTGKNNNKQDSEKNKTKIIYRFSQKISRIFKILTNLMTIEF